MSNLYTIVHFTKSFHIYYLIYPTYQHWDLGKGRDCYYYFDHHWISRAKQDARYKAGTRYGYAGRIKINRHG